MTTSALKQLAKLEALEAKKADLMQQLKRSLLIQELWPEAFEHGAVTTQAIGNPRNIITWTIVDGNGTDRCFPLSTVPVELWPKDLIDKLKNDRPGASKYARIFHEWLRAQA
jgi:hypothetical protein